MMDGEKAIAHPQKTRSPIHPKTRSPIHKKMRSPIHKKPDRPSTKNPIAGPQKPGFFRNTSLQPTDVDKNLAVNCQLSTVNCLTPSNRRKCTRPDASPATTVTPSGAIAQSLNAASPLKLAISLPVSKSQIFRV